MAAVITVLSYFYYASRQNTSDSVNKSQPQLLTDKKPQQASPPSNEQLRAKIGSGVQAHCLWSNMTTAKREKAFDMIAAANISSVRIDMSWEGFEPQNDQYNQWYIKQADECVDLALKRDLDVLVTWHMTPSWANGSQGIQTPPSDPDDFGEFAGWAAEYFAGRVSQFQIWNEPDPSQDFFRGSTSEYVELLKSAYDHIKSVDQKNTIVLGGPSSNDAEWVREMYEAGGKNYFDVMTTHPYQAVANLPPNEAADNEHWWFSTFPRVMEVMREYGDEDKPVWFTEFGYSTHANQPGLENHNLGVTEQQQADYLIQAYEFARAGYPSVERLYVYGGWNRTDGNEQINNFGIMDADFSPKPSYLAIQRYFE